MGMIYQYLDVTVYLMIMKSVIVLFGLSLHAINYLLIIIYVIYL